MSLRTNSNETLIRMTQEHWIKYVLPAFVYIVLTAMSLGLFFFSGWTAYHSEATALIAYLLALFLFFFAHHWFFMRLLGESMTHIVVTNYRVIRIHERFFSSERMTEYAFEKMKTVEAHKKGLLQTILRYGSIRFESGSDVKLVPHPNSIAKDIEQAMGML